MASIAVLTPSRERPEQLHAMVDAIVETACDKVTVYVGIDDGDPSDYPTPGTHFVSDTVTVRVLRGPRTYLGNWVNRLTVPALLDSHDILAFFGDDHRPRSHGWDLKVADAMRAMGLGLVYTRDGLQDERLPTAPFWHGDIIRALGYYCPPGLKHMWIDNFWVAFARGLGRVTYLDDVLVQHLHPSAPGGNAYDAVNAANDAHEREDMHNFHNFLNSPEYRAALDRVRAVL